MQTMGQMQKVDKSVIDTRPEIEKFCDGREKQIAYLIKAWEKANDLPAPYAGMVIEGWMHNAARQESDRCNIVDEVCFLMAVADAKADFRRER